MGRYGDLNSIRYEQFKQDYIKRLEEQKKIHPDRIDNINAEIDFLKKNKNLVRAVTKRIAGIIISALLKAVLKKITELVTDAIRKRLEDKAKSNLKQLLSLIGVPQDVIQKIKNL